MTENGFDLYAKSDFKFMESAFKFLRDFTDFKANITIFQFFNEGFAEHKMLLCAQVCRLMREK